MQDYSIDHVENQMKTEEEANTQDCFVKPSYLYNKDDSYEPDYIVDDLFLSKTLIMLAGSPGSMKSWLLMALLIALAAGLNFLGRVTKKVKFFYFDRENPEDLWYQRLVQYCSTRVSDDYVYIWPYWKHPPPPKFLDPMYLELAKNNPGSTWVFDSYSKFLPKGYKENINENAADVTNFLRELTVHDITIILIHHAGKDSSNGVRGAEEILAGVDVAFTLSKNENRLTMKSIKNRFSSDSTILIDVKTDIDGCIFFEDVSQEEQELKERKLNEQAKVARQVISDFTMEGKSVSKEAVKKELKARLSVSEYITRKIIEHGLKRKFFTYDLPTKQLAVVVDLSGYKYPPTTTTSDISHDRLLNQQSTSVRNKKNTNPCPATINAIVDDQNQQASTTPTNDENEYFIPEIEEGEVWQS